MWEGAQRCKLREARRGLSPQVGTAVGCAMHAPETPGREGRRELFTREVELLHSNREPCSLASPPSLPWGEFEKRPLQYQA